MALFEDKQVFLDQLSAHGVIGLAKIHNVTHGAILYYKRKWDDSRKVKRPLTYVVQENVVYVTDSYGREFTIDLDDAEKVKPYQWYVHQNYVKRMDGKVTVLLHRHIMDCPEGMIVDHINHDTFDNRRSNLRIVTPSQNNMNRSMSKNNKSGIKGVFFVKSRNKWRAEIHYCKKKIHLGIFHTLQEAVDARREAEEKYFGEHAYNQ